MRLFLVLVLAAAGCYSPSYRDCAVSCALSQECPDGFSCDGVVCRAPGMKDTPCGSADDAGIDSGKLEGIPLDDFAYSLFTGLCEHAVRCGMHGNLADCRSMIPIAERNNIAAIVAGVHAGEVVYDPDAAARCVAAFSAVTCLRYGEDSFVKSGQPVECLDVFTGTLPSKAACDYNEECVSRVCQRDATCDPNTACCSGVCAGDAPPQVKMVGSSCTSADYCVDSYCALNAPQPTCTARKQANEDCYSDRECGNDLYCLPSGSTDPGSCKRALPQGDECALTRDCLQLSNVCTQLMCTESGLPGTACQGTGNFSDCQPGHFCVFSQCTLPPAINAPCNKPEFPFCRPDAFCFAGLTCFAREPNGAECMNDSECASDVCELTGGVGDCVPAPVCLP